MNDLQLASMYELLRLRQKIERDPKYRAPLRGLTPEGRRLHERIQDEIERRVRKAG